MNSIVLENRWNFPRDTIASGYKENDLGYATSGAVSAIWCLGEFNILPQNARTMTILDYGCGTGRVSRPLTSMFKQVIAFDPSVPCIETLTEENKRCYGVNSGLGFRNLIATSDFAQVPMCDLAICINVIEHLNQQQATVLINNLKAKVSGETLICYKLLRHSDVLAPFLTNEQFDEDIKASMVVRKLNFNKPINYKKAK